MTRLEEPGAAARADELLEAQTTIAHLRVALETNRRIGMAIGILMATRSVTEDTAFELLRVASQDQHRKLRTIADEVVFTGTIQQRAI